MMWVKIRNSLLGQYLIELIRGIDQLLNAILGGYARETISSRCGRLLAMRRCLLCKIICLLLHPLERDHCKKAMAAEKEVVKILLDFED